MTNRKIINFLGPEKSISKKDFQVKNFNFSPPAPNCTFDRSGARRVRDFCTSPFHCDAGFDFLGSERAKGSKFRAGAVSNRGPMVSSNEFLVGRTHRIRSRGLQIGAHSPCLQCTTSSNYVVTARCSSTPSARSSSPCRSRHTCQC